MENPSEADPPETQKSIMPIYLSKITPPKIMKP